MIELPEVGAPLVLREPDGGSYRSRLQDIDGDLLVVDLPADLPATQLFDEGAQFELTWTMATGVHVMPVELAGSRTERLLRLWELAIAGEPWTEQRRAHVRVPVTGAVTLAVAPETDAEAPEPITGLLVDISEAAAQCQVSALSDDPRLAGDTAVTVRFTLRDEQFELPGVIYSSRAATQPGRAVAVVQFHHSERQADALRKQVFAVQLEARRSRRG
jgi:c-di-GMP-binding flagellar brake protein YcgR